jgi:hypothetical protein
MRGKVIQLLTTVAASVYACAMVPQPARAHGDVVSMNEVFMPQWQTVILQLMKRVSREPSEGHIACGADLE